MSAGREGSWDLAGLQCFLSVCRHHCKAVFGGHIFSQSQVALSEVGVLRNGWHWPGEHQGSAVKSNQLQKICPHWWMT